ncbi:hypothetical protein NMG60_11016802 [Bertholletia excelsa]
MVSFHSLLSPTQRKAMELESSSKKRKWEESQDEDNDSEMPLEPKTPKSITGRNLNFRALQSSPVERRASVVARASPEPPSPGHTNLDLQLNLQCGTKSGDNLSGHDSGGSSENSGEGCLRNKTHVGGIRSGWPSWVEVEGEQVEMIAAVCKRCHMLVMMFKSSPACPNCKFMHPQEDLVSTEVFNKPRLSRTLC